MRTDNELKHVYVQGTILDWCEGFLFDRRAQMMAPGTIQYYTNKLRGFVRWCNMRQLVNIEEITPKDMRDFLIYLQFNHNRGGVIAYFKALRAMFNWIEAEIDIPSPMHKIKMPKNTLPPLEPANEEDIARMIAVSNTRDKAILLFLVDTGLRASELLNLNTRDVNLINGMVNVYYGKGGKHRVAYIGRKTKRALRKYIKHEGPLFQTDEGDRLSYWGLRQIMVRRSQQARVKTPVIHSFRRLFCLSMYRAGVDEISIQMLMGISSKQVLKRYAKLTNEDLLRAHMRGSPADNLL